MRRRGLAGCVVALAVLAAPAAGRTVTVSDPRDAAGPLDVTRVKLGEASRGRLRVTVRMALPFTADDLRTEGRPPGSVCLKLWTRRTPRRDPPDYLACAVPGADGDRLRGSVVRESVNGLPRRVGDADVGRPSARDVVLRFAKRKVGSPRTLRFAVETVTWRDCPAPRGCVDDTPRAPRTETLRTESERAGQGR